MAVEQRPGGRWRVKWREAGGQQRSQGGFASRTEAEAWERRNVHARAASARGQLLPNVALGGEPYDAWFERISERHAPSTVARYVQEMEHVVLPALASRRVRAITRRHLEELVEARCRDDGSPVSEGTRSKLVTVLRALFRDLERMGYILDNPAAGLEVQAHQPARGGWPTPEQVTTLAAACRPYLRRYLHVLLYTGMRPGEAAQLTWDRVHRSHRDPARHSIVVPGTKTDASRDRRVPVLAQLQPVLDELEEATGGDNWVVTGERGGKLPLRSASRAVTRQCRDMIAEGKLDREIDPRDLRHVYATVLIRSGADHHQVKSAMGHASVVTTINLYADLWAEDVSKLGELAQAGFERYLPTPQS